jgi:hypothetical protein
MRRSQSRPLLIAAFALGCAGCSVPSTGIPPADVPATSAASAAECAAKLPPAAGIIYKDAAADVHAETNMESLLRFKVMMLIATDRIKRSEARPAAERAAECLEMLQR